MALGGGIWTSQNKKMPGTYINFVSANRATSTLSERGYAAMPLNLNWGVEGEVFTITNENFEKNALTLFGYEASSENLKGLRDLFLNAKTLYAYRLGTSTKASCTYATAKYGGTRGNDLKIVITAILEDEEITGYTVKTLLGTTEIDSQTTTGTTTNSLTDNEFLTWNSSVNLAAGTTNLTNGANATVTTNDYQTFLDKIEPYSFNSIGCADTTNTVKELFVDFTKRMRDEQGIKFQCVLHRCNTADYEGIISVENNLAGSPTTDNASLVYWTVGASAGCQINKSNTNKIYDGEFDIDVDYTQTQLETAIDNGKFIFHKVGDEVRVLEDINTFVTITDEKGNDFKYNQTIRVLDQIANDIANIFNTKYLGKIANNESGRISLWNDIVSHHQELQTLQAIENFESNKISVDAGATKTAVVVYDAITPINCMEQLYMSVQVN